MQEIKLELVNESKRLAFDNLFYLYHHELSIYIPELYPFVDEEGYYDRKATDDFYNKPNSVIEPYIIRCDTKIAGVMVFSRPPYVKPGCDYCIQELFLLNNYRRKGIAEEACKILLNEYPGRYCIQVITENLKAMKFWNKLITKNGTLISQEKYSNILTTFEFNIKGSI